MEQIIGLDTSVFVYHFDQHLEFGDAATQVLTNVAQGKYQAIFSSIGVIELLTGPKGIESEEFVNSQKQVIEQLDNFTVINTNKHIVLTASDLRAKYNISTPDAIHLATAIFLEADYFLTNDKKLRKVKEVRVKLLK